MQNTNINAPKASSDNIKPIIIESLSTDPWFNLALEEYLFLHAPNDEIILYLWQNNNTVVIGRNQNAWKECNLKSMESDNVKLARRLSGGGAVYHDLGNMNFTFIMNQKYYDINRQLSVLIDALSSFNIKAEFSGRNDMLIDNRKFSGHAYYYKGDRAYHHGTLLTNSDLTKLGNYLSPSKKKIQSKGVDSVKSRVINISDIKNDISILTLAASLKNSFRKIYGNIFDYRVFGEGLDNFEILDDLKKKYSSWEWRCGESPKFDISFSDRFDWGEIDIAFTLKNGIIKNMNIFTDAMDAELFNEFTKGFLESKLDKESLVQKCIENSLHMPEKVQIDLIKFFENIDL